MESNTEESYALYKRDYKDCITVLQSYMKKDEPVIVEMKVIYFNRFDKKCHMSKAVFSPYNMGLCTNGSVEMEIEGVEKLAKTLSNLSTSDNGRDFYEVIFCKNKYRVCVIRDGASMVIKSYVGECKVLSPQNVVRVKDVDEEDDDDDELQALPAGESGALNWKPNFYTYYFKKCDDLKNISRELLNFVAKVRRFVKEEEKKNNDNKNHLKRER